jgi:hypothetical protein
MISGNAFADLKQHDALRQNCITSCTACLEGLKAFFDQLPDNSEETLSVDLQQSLWTALADVEDYIMRWWRIVEYHTEISSGVTPVSVAKSKLLPACVHYLDIRIEPIGI